MPARCDPVLLAAAIYRDPHRGVGCRFDRDPNDRCAEHDDPRYIVDLLKRIVTVRLDTMKIVDALPALDILASPTEG